jgi:rsbT co-antagonist protein RsbR
MAYQKELEEKLETIERQRAAISELSTPVIEIWNGVICLPVVGVMDTARSAEMTEAILRATVEKNAKCTIIDITGIEVMDTGTADHFIRMAKAIRLLGARCVVTGISPTIAQTIVHMGVRLDGVTTRRSLRDALQDFVRGRIDVRDTDSRDARDARDAEMQGGKGPRGSGA